jgi:hypothetical protein
MENKRKNPCVVQVEENPNHQFVLDRSYQADPGLDP